MFLLLKKNLFSLHNRYIPALTLIAIFSTLAFVNVQHIMDSIENDGKLINMSGRQRMLSQNIVLTSQEYLKTKDQTTFKILQDKYTLMDKEYRYLLSKQLPDELKKIYFKEKLNEDIEVFLVNMKKFIETKQESLLETLENNSKNLLPRLNRAVAAYEQENKQKLQVLKNREKYLYILTLLTLIFEALFIFYPASSKIQRYKKELEREVDKKTKELQDSFELISQHIIYSQTDLKGFVTYASKAFCEITGYKKDELVGKPHNIIRHPDMPKAAFKEMWETIKDGKQWTGEVKNLKKDGGYYWVVAHISPNYDSENNLIGYSGVRHDITDKKALDELNQNLTKKVQKETAKNREKDQKLFKQEKMTQMMEMIGNIAHHWRQPLSVISTATSGMQLQKEYNMLNDESFEEATQNILTQTENLSKTIEQFAQYLHLEDIKSYFSLEEHLKQTLNIVNFTLQNFDIELITKFEQGNEEIYSNKENISQVLLNIIYNARDILVERKVQKPKIFVSLENDKNRFIINIEDNGGGIPNENLNKIFEPYFTTKHKSVGTGLGLSLCYSLITTKLKGKIVAQNSSDGAVFTIKLPKRLLNETK